MASGDYYDQGQSKFLLDIEHANAKYDERLDQLGEDANRDVDDVMYLYAVTLPLTSDQKESARNMANRYTCWQFKLTQNAPSDVVRMWKEAYTDAKDKLIAKLKAQPSSNTQTRSVAYAQDYRSTPLSTRTGL